MDRANDSRGGRAGDVRFPDDLLIADFGDEGAVAFRLADRVPRVLNPAAAVVVARLREGGSVRDAAEALVKRFGIDSATAARDVSALLDALTSDGIAGTGAPPKGAPPLPEGWESVWEETMADEPVQDPETAPPPIPEEAVPFLTETGNEVVFREEDEGAFLFEPERGELSCLNPVGIRVWKSLDGKRTLRGLVDDVLAEYEGAERATVTEDVRAFLGELKGFGYVDWK